MAPALVGFSEAEDRINRLLAEASAEAADVPVAIPVIVPPQRLRDTAELDRLVASVLADGVSAYLLWTPGVTEELLLSDRDLLIALLRLVVTLAARGIPVGHLHATYTIAALHDAGMSALVHHTGWVDKGEPVGEPHGGVRSCRTFIPGVRRSLQFDQASALGRSLDHVAYVERYCACAFCVGAFDANQHPLDLLLEDQVLHFANGRDRRTPTGRAVGLNTWHYLLSRRQEIEAFRSMPATDVLQRDIDRAGMLAGDPAGERLRRLANELRSA